MTWRATRTARAALFLHARSSAVINAGLYQRRVMRGVAAGGISGWHGISKHRQQRRVARHGGGSKQ